MQLVAGNWLFKLETFYRTGQNDDFYALVGGFEYTFSGFAGSNMDLGILSEWAYDNRGKESYTFNDNDAIFGIRLGLNDLAGTEILIGTSQDINTSARVGILEVSRRIGSNLRASLTGRGFFNFPKEDIFYSLRKDDFLRLEIAYYF